MIATNELRFVERETGKTLVDEFGYFQKETIHVLQQKWVGDDYTVDNKPLIKTEWRDVPLVKEET